MVRNPLSVLFQVLMLYALFLYIAPWVKNEIRTARVQESSTHRLAYAPRSSSWRVFSTLVNAPSHGHGECSRSWLLFQYASTESTLILVVNVLALGVLTVSASPPPLSEMNTLSVPFQAFCCGGQ